MGQKCFFILFVFFVCGIADEIYEIEPPDMVDDSEYGSKFEGDMDLNDDQLDEISNFRNAKSEHKYRWPNAIVAYNFSSNYTADENAWIVRAMEEIERVSCVRFVRRTNETDYVQFKAANDGCYSAVGRQGGEQRLNLEKSFQPGFGCFRIGKIIHQLLHTLGFYHMQSVPERDNYVKIHWENINLKKKHNFKTYNTSFSEIFNLPYDFGSIMYYGPFAFAENTKRPTITTIIRNRTLVMGQREAMSPNDIIKLNMFYHCEAAKKNHGIQLRAQYIILSVMLITIHSILLFQTYETTRGRSILLTWES